MLNKIFSLILSFAFIFSGLPQIPAVAQSTSSSGAEFSIGQLPAPGSMVMPAANFVPLTLKGLVIHPENALKLDFFMDTCNTGLQGASLKDEALKVMKYFLTALTVPEEDMWVNLSPYENS